MTEAVLIVMGLVVGYFVLKIALRAILWLCWCLLWRGVKSVYRLIASRFQRGDQD